MSASLHCILFIFLSVLLVGCGPASESDSAKQSVWVSILPQKYFAERIGGDVIDVRVLLRPGQSPETYAPSAAELGRVAKADIYFGIGMPVERAVLGNLATSMKGVRFVQTGSEPADHHDHAHVHTHDEGEPDPHIWLDPIRMISVVEQMQAALSASLPAHAETFQQNASALIRDLRTVDDEIRAILTPHVGRMFLINHPSLGHFADHYGLEQFSIEHAGASPSARRVAELVSLARDAGVGVVLTQPEFGRSSARILAQELELEMIEIDPLAEDYLNNLRIIAEAIAKGFGDE